MSLDYTNASLSATVTASELNQNFADIVQKFERGLVDGDFASGAAISSKKLAEQFYEGLFNATYVYDGTALSAKTEGVPLAILGLLEPSNLGEYKVLSANWLCDDTGDGNTTFHVCLGYYDSSETLVELYKVIEDEPIAVGPAGAGSIFQGACSIDRAELSWEGVQSTKPLILYLTRGSKAGSGTVDSDSDFLSVTLRMILPLNS